MIKKFMGIIAIAIAGMLTLSACQFGDPTAGTNIDSETLAAMKVDPELVKNKVDAVIELENGGEIKLELYPDLAPDTVQNFVELAEYGFYDDTIFHRVIDNFMIQGGGYDENLKKLNTNTIKGEFSENGFENTLSHIRGVISMARAQDVNSATSQFFIVQQDAEYLDGKYAAFGRVTDGMDIVDEIASVRTGSVAAQGMENVPVDPIVISSITINNGSSISSSSDSGFSGSGSSGSIGNKIAPTPTNNPFASPDTGYSDSNSGLDEDMLRRILGGEYDASSSSQQSIQDPFINEEDDEPIARGNLNPIGGSNSIQ